MGAHYFAVLEILWPQYDYFKIHKFTVQLLNTKDYKIGLRSKAGADGRAAFPVGRRGLAIQVGKAQLRPL